jgi:hypothetical protein
MPAPYNGRVAYAGGFMSRTVFALALATLSASASAQAGDAGMRDAATGSGAPRPASFTGSR